MSTNTDSTSAPTNGIDRGRYDPATIAVSTLLAIPFLLGLLIGAIGMAVWTMTISGDGW